MSLLRRLLLIGRFARDDGNGVAMIERLPFENGRAGTDLENIICEGAAFAAGQQQQKRQQQRKQQPVAAVGHERLRQRLRLGRGRQRPVPAPNLGAKPSRHKLSRQATLACAIA